MGKYKCPILPPIYQVCSLTGNSPSQFSNWFGRCTHVMCIDTWNGIKIIFQKVRITWNRFRPVIKIQSEFNFLNSNSKKHKKNPQTSKVPKRWLSITLPFLWLKKEMQKLGQWSESHTMGLIHHKKVNLINLTTINIHN